MNMKFSWLSTVTVLIFTAIITSCGKDRQILERIPADVDQVSTFRAKSIMENMGVSFNDNSVEVPDWLSDAVSDDTARLLSLLADGNLCDINELICAVKADDVFFVMPVFSADKLAEALAGDVDWLGDFSGYKVGRAGSSSLLLADDCLWVEPQSSNDPKQCVKTLDDFIKSADKGSVAQLDGILQGLQADNLVNIAVNQSAAPLSKSSDSGKTSSWVMASVGIKDNKIVIESQFMEGDGTPVPVKGLQPINPAVLSYVPASAWFTAAMGVTSDFNWDVFMQLAKLSGRFEAVSAMSMAMPYLKTIDGTVLFSAGPANNQAFSDLDPENWRFLAMARLSQEKINEVTGQVRAMVFAAGLNAPEVGNGIYRIPVGGPDIYIGNVDGYLAAANFPFNPNSQNSFTPLFEGKSSAAKISIPSLNLFSPSAPDFGIDVDICDVSDSKGRAVVSLTDVDGPILEALVKAMVNL